MSLIMMCLLKTQFDDFHAEYGCFLKTVVTIQGVSLLIQTIINALISENEAVINWVYSPTKNQVIYSILSISYNIVAFIVPILNQLSCLIFVWIRNSRGANKFKRPNLVRNQKVHYLEKSQQKRPDYITVFDPTVEYYMVDVAKYMKEYQR